MNTSQANGVIQTSVAPASRPKFPFAILFLVWVLVVVITTLVTMVLPESFASTARIKVERDQSDIPGMAGDRLPAGYDPYYIQTEFELIQSEVILGSVIEHLNLNKEWGKKYANGDILKTPETMTLLKGRIDLRPVRNTSLIEIRVYSEKAAEAADIANAVAGAYRDYRLNERVRKISGSIRVLEQAYDDNNSMIRSIRAEIADVSLQQAAQRTNGVEESTRRLEDLQRFAQVLFTKLAAEKVEMTLPATSMVQIVDTAMPGLRPVRPNKPLNIMIGIVVGGFGGLFLATLVYLLQRRELRRKAGVPRTPFPPRFRAIVHILIALVVGVVVGYHCASPMESTTFIVVPLSLLLGGIASAWIELANTRSIPASVGALGQTEPNDTAFDSKY